MPEGTLHIATFITLCEALLGIAPHFMLWRWVFQVVLLFPGGRFPAMGGARIQVRPHAAGQYLALTRPPGFDAKMRWRRRWFYLPNMVLVLLSFLEGRLGASP